MAVLALVAGCRDNVVGPAAASSAAPASSLIAPEGRPSLSLSGGSDWNTTADFTISPRGGVYGIGNHAVVFPANSVCDPAKSGYGEGTWDEPCPVLEAPIQIHATTRIQDGHEWVAFSPDIRFVPSRRPARWVWMFMYTPQVIGATGDLSQFNILYAPQIGGTLVNDALADPTLRTYVDTRSGISSRRIKHFSGYASSAGNSCDPANPTCAPTSPMF